MKPKYKRGDLVIIRGKLAGMILCWYESQESYSYDYRVLIDGKGTGYDVIDDRVFPDDFPKDYFFLLRDSGSLAVLEIPEKDIALFNHRIPDDIMEWVP